jgi:NADH dehydrogenase FAD-containing subunit
MTPLLASAATGSLDLRSTMEPVRANKHTHFYHAWAEKVDLQKNTLTLMPAYPPAFREADPMQIASDAAAKAKAQQQPNASSSDSKKETALKEESKSSVARVEAEGRAYELPFDKLVIS